MPLGKKSGILVDSHGERYDAATHRSCPEGRHGCRARASGRALRAAFGRCLPVLPTTARVARGCGGCTPGHVSQCLAQPQRRMRAETPSRVALPDRRQRLLERAALGARRYPARATRPEHPRRARRGRRSRERRIARAHGGPARAAVAPAARARASRLAGAFIRRDRGADGRIGLRSRDAALPGANQGRRRARQRRVAKAACALGPRAHHLALCIPAYEDGRDYGRGAPEARSGPRRWGGRASHRLRCSADLLATACGYGGRRTAPPGSGRLNGVIGFLARAPASRSRLEGPGEHAHEFERPS
jgi:hypothetical protein